MFVMIIKPLVKVFQLLVRVIPFVIEPKPIVPWACKGFGMDSRRIATRSKRRLNCGRDFEGKFPS